MGERPRTWQQAERRALVADLVRTQGTLQARSEQLREIFASRWYRLARFTWRLRRGAIFRRVAPPRLAGEDSFARPLNGAAPASEAAEVRLVPAPPTPAPAGAGVAVDLERRRWLAEARAPGLDGLRVAAVLDEATEACLAPECALDTGFGPGEWRERLEAEPPHLLLVESAWAGNGGSWSGALAPAPDSPQAGLPALRELIAWCREREIPSAFWATRDPLGFDRFSAAASLCDHVFTVDAGRIPAYRALQGVAIGGVSALPLAAQPRLHNPIGAERRFPVPAFAGGFDRGWPRERLEMLIELIDAVSEVGGNSVVIYEPAPGPAAPEQRFPARLRPKVEGRFSYREIVATYKAHPLFISAGPSGDSPTAVQPQLFELLASGTPVLSTPSAAIEQILGDLVPTAGNYDEAVERLQLLLDRRRRRELVRRGQRLVLGAHTYRDRLAELATTIGFELPPSAAEEIAVLVPAEVGDALGSVTDSLLAQSLAPNEVLVGLAGDAGAGGDLERLRERYPGARVRTLVQDGETPRSQQLRELARLATAAWVAPVVSGVDYGPHHLRDLVACACFAEAEVIGFSPAGEDEGRAGEPVRRPHRYADAVSPDAALAARALVAERGWPYDEAAMRRWFAQGVRIYAGEAADAAAEGAE